MSEWCAVINVNEKFWLVNRQGFYLMCKMQDVEFGFIDEVPRGEEEKEKMYVHILEWLVDNKMAIKLEHNPHYLKIRLDEL